MLIEDTAEVCEIHNSSLVEGRVSVLYGLIQYSGKYIEARKAQFPRSRFLVLGGCVLGNVFFHNIRYCVECRESHRAWAIENGTKEGLSPAEEEHEKYIKTLAARIGIRKVYPSQFVG